MSRNFYLNPIFLFFALILFSCTPGSQRKQDETKPAGKSERFDYNWLLTGLDGTPLHLDSLRQKVLFINIWATWCAPCKEELPDIQRLYNRIDNRDIRFLLVSREHLRPLQDYAKLYNLDLPMYSAPQMTPQMFSGQYIPRTYVLDRFGQIVYQHTGIATWDLPEMVEFLNFLVSVKIKE